MLTAVSSPKSFAFTKPALAVRGLSVRYGRAAVALSGASFEVGRGETLAVVGPSGAGKTTLLRAIAGLLTLASGAVELDGRPVQTLTPQARRIALVFQQDALVATMSVSGNLRFAQAAGTGGAATVDRVAGELGVRDLLQRRPSRLSGGERQRVAIARALLARPRALLLDEPFAHLDPPLRVAMRSWLLAARAELTGPLIYVTHDHAEALSIGTRVAVLIAGRLCDLGTPERVYERPVHVDVARFLGERPMNVIDAPGVFFAGDALVGIRAEHIAITADGGIPGQIRSREMTGPDAYLRVVTAHGEVLVRSPAAAVIPIAVALSFPREHVRRFDRHSGAAVD